MKNGHPYDRFRRIVVPVLDSKRDEFKILGYDEITEDELWKFLKNKKWRNADPNAKLHEIVQSILSVKASDYISYLSIEAYKNAEFLSEEDRLSILNN